MRKSTHFYSLLLTALFLLPWSGMKAETLTVAEGTDENSYNPVYTYNADTQGGISQIIYPASLLSNLENGTITAVKFYAKSNLAWNGSGYSSVTIPTFEVRITETTSASFSSTAALTVPNTASYSGQPTKDVDYLLFNLATPYEYQGGNLLIEVKIATAGQWQSTVKFYGVNQTNNQCYYNSPGYSGTSGCSAFLPKTTFTYNPGEAPACPKPKNLHVDAILPDGASIAWEQKGTETVYQWACVETGESVTAWNDLAEDVRTYTIHGLTAGTVYDFYVRSNCGDGESNKSEFAKQSFTPECAAPENVRTTAKGTSSATLAWDEVTGISKYQFVCVRKDVTPNWDGVVEQSGLSVSIDTLVPGKSYDFYVRSYFNGSIQSTASKLNFITAFALPVVEDFENTEFPAGWSKSSQWTLYNYSGYGYNSDGTMRYTSSTTSDLTLPEIAITEPAQISFWRQSSYVSCGVYVNDGTTTTSLGSFAKNSSWKKDSVDLSAYVGQTITLIIRGNYYSGSRYLYVDDIAVTYLPIAVPTSLAATPTADGAVVTWAHAENGPFDLQYRATGTEDWTTVNNINAKTYTIEGLNEVEYEVQVRANVSAHRISAWTASQTFTPSSCPTVTAAWLSEKTYTGLKVSCTLSFENKKWDLQRKIDDGAWTTIGTEITATYQEVAVEVGHTYYFQVKPTCGSDWSDAGSFTPEYPTPGTPSVTATTTTASVTWTAAEGADGYEYEVKEGTAAATWTAPVASVNASPAALSELTDGTNYTVYVRAKYGEGRSAEVSKNFTTETIAPAFTNAAASISGTTATVALNAYNGSATQLQYVVMNGSAAANWTSATLVAKTTTSIEVPGLSVGGSYTIYIRAYYSSTLQSAADSKFFEIPCETQSLPFAVEGFDHSGNLPTCWDNSTYSGNAWTMDNGNYYKSASYSARYNANGNSSKYADLKTPSITLSEDALLKFYLRNKVGSSATNKVTAEVYIYDGTTTTKLDDIPYASSGETTMTQQASMDLSEYTGKTVNIIFRAHGYGASASLYIDNVEIQFKPIDAPTNVAAAATTDGAVVTWEHAENVPFDLKYRTNGAGEWTTVNGINAKTYTIEGLNEVEYEVQVRAHASEHRISDWTASQTFTPQCPNVTSVTYTNPTYNSVTVNWEASGSATWALRYKAAGDADYTVASSTISEMTYNLTGLTTGTVYNVEVKATCKADADYFAAATYTPACSAPSNVTIASITDAAASASWDAVADAPNGYKYIVVEAGETPNWASATATEELTASLSSLAGLTDYDFYVAAVYGDHVEAAEKVNFQTVAVAPTALTQGTTTVNSIAFSWSYAGAATQFQWKSSKAGSVWSAPISATNAEEIGLTAGTPYTIYVRAYYADGKYSSELSETFGTECAVLSLPFSQDFEDGVSPLCWTAATSTADYYDYDGNYGWKVAEDNDGNYVMRYKSAAGVIYPVLTLPQIDLTATPAVLSFKVLNNYSNKTVAGNVTVSAEGVEDLVTALTTSSSLTEQRIDLTAFAGKRITVKFQATNNIASGRIDLDDIRILEQLTLADNANNTATLSANLNKTVDVTIGRTFVRADYYNTICLPFSLSAEELAASPIATEDLWAFKYAKVDETTGDLLFRIVEAESIEAGVPYFIGLAGTGNIENPLFKNVTISATTGQNIGDASVAQLCGIVDQPVVFEQNDQTKLFLAANNTLYWWAGTSNSQLNSFRAYFKVNTGGGSSQAPVYHGMPARLIKQEATPTDVEQVQGAENISIKVLENNQVIIIRNGVKYTIQGQKIQ